MVVHRGHPGRTVVQQIANLWHDYGELGTTMGEAFSNAFNVEPVISAFFGDYKDAYDDAVRLIATKVGQGDAEQFAQTLFNRLLFVHFVSRKGWRRIGVLSVAATSGQMSNVGRYLFGGGGTA